jgi:HEAT repeat protein
LDDPLFGRGARIEYIVNMLVKALGDSSEEVRRSAIQSVRRIWEGVDGGDNRFVGTLRNHRDAHARCLATIELGEINDAHAVEALCAALEDPDAAIRQGATVILGRLGDARAVEPLIRLCESWVLREGVEDVADALGKIGDERAVEALTNSL